MLALISAALAADLVSVGAQVQSWSGDPVVQPTAGVRVPVWSHNERSVVLVGADWTGTWGAHPTGLHQLSAHAELLHVFERSVLGAELQVGAASDLRSPLAPATRLSATAFWARTGAHWDLGGGLSWQTSTVARLPVPVLYVGWRPDADLTVEALLPWSLAVHLGPSRPLSLRLSSSLDGSEWHTQGGRYTVWGVQARAALIARLGGLEIRAGAGWQRLGTRELGPQSLPGVAGPIGFVEVAVPLW